MATKKKRVGIVPKGAKRTGVSKPNKFVKKKGVKKKGGKVLTSKTLDKQTPKKITRKGSRFTPEITANNKLIMLQAVRDKLSIQYACDQVGMSRATFYEWMKRDEDFAREVVAAQEGACDLLEECLMDRAKDRRNKGGATAAIFLLKGRRSDIYHDKTHNVVTGAEGGPVQVASWTDLVQLAMQKKGTEI